METSPVDTKDMVISLIKAHQSRIQALGVKRLGVFGSFARGEPSAESDIDLLVEFDPGRKTFDSYMQLAFLLKELLRRRVELVTAESLSSHIGPHSLGEVEYVVLTP